MAWPTITDLGTVPSRTQTPATFSANANAFLGALPTFRTELNSFGAYGDSFQTTVEGYKNDAESAQTAAETAQGLAEDARDAALASANYKGSWSSLTGALNIPASVSHDNVVWNLNTNLADVTASEPSATNTDWTAINGIDYNVVEITTTGSISPVRNTFYHTGSLSGDVTTTLPTAADSEGLVLLFKKLEASHTWTIDGNASETIDGDTTYDLTDQYEYVCLCCDGAGWNIVSRTTVEVNELIDYLDYLYSVKHSPSYNKALHHNIWKTRTVQTASSGTFTVPANVYYVMVACCGAGGNATSNSGPGTGGAGGGGGGLAVKFLRVSPGDTIPWTISGGVATCDGMTANPGSDAVTTTGGAGGTASGGDYNYTGGSGGSTDAASTSTNAGGGGCGGGSAGTAQTSSNWACSGGGAGRVLFETGAAGSTPTIFGNASSTKMGSGASALYSAVNPYSTSNLCASPGLGSSNVEPDASYSAFYHAGKGINPNSLQYLSFCILSDITSIPEYMWDAASEPNQGSSNTSYLPFGSGMPARTYMIASFGVGTYGGVSGNSFCGFGGGSGVIQSANQTAGALGGGGGSTSGSYACNGGYGGGGGARPTNTGGLGGAAVVIFVY